MDWIGLAQDRDKYGDLVKAVMSLGDSIKCCETIDQPHNWWSLK
jgi:hypothetical protein